MAGVTKEQIVKAKEWDLLSYLQTYEPQELKKSDPRVTQISLCLDNDKAGLEGMARLEQAIQDDAELSGRVKLVYHNPPKLGKDYNEFLCMHIKDSKKELHRKKEPLR